MIEPDILAKVEYYSAEYFTNKEYLSTDISVRADHLIKENYLTCGEHYYFDEEKIYPKQKYKAHIRFISPDAYPNCLWVGKVIKIQRGNYILGEAIVTEIYNQKLKKKS
jgi:hypothetical protein